MNLQDRHATDFGEFFAGYLIGLAFTATKDDENGNGDPVFSNPGGDIKDVVDLDNFMLRLGAKNVSEIREDARDFFDQAYDMIKDDLNRAGGDFHLTRNRHGAGFWDGDWKDNGDKLTELSRPYGTLELTEHADVLYLHS